jgi:hypothetical protein
LLTTNLLWIVPVADAEDWARNRYVFGSGRATATLLCVPLAGTLPNKKKTKHLLWRISPSCSEDPDKVSAEIVEEEEEREVFGKCDECGMEGKFFGKEGDDWTCSACLYGGGDSDSEEGEELLVCLYCGRDERECEAKATDKDNGNPITVWKPFNWGMSCDECYYQHHPDPEDYDDEDPECCKCGTTTDTKGMGGVEHREDLDGGWWCGRCYEYATRNPCDWCRVIGEGGEPEERDYDEFISTPQDCPCCEMERQEIIADTEKDELNSAIDASGNALY